MALVTVLRRFGEAVAVVDTGLDGKVLRRTEDGYERARAAATWHAGTPDRFPAYDPDDTFVSWLGRPGLDEN